MRLRKFIGMLILVGGLILYALLAMKLAVWILPEDMFLVELVFYIFAGAIWVWPAGKLIAWMQRPD